MYYFDRVRDLKRYSFHIFKADVVAGLIVALVALPLAMSFAIAIGVKPEYGLIAAIIGGAVAALFGGSDANVTGPTGAFIAILSTIVFKFGYEQLLIAGFMAGIILLIAGFFRFGKFIEYIPYPVTIGFTVGIAVIIATSQMGNVFGLRGLERHEFFHENVVEIISHLSLLDVRALVLAVATILMMVYIPKINAKTPSALVAVIVTSIVVWLLGLDVATIGSVFGAIPSSLPALQFPTISFSTIRELMPAAFSIAALGAIESLLSCVIADGMTRKTHSSNHELIGQGLANVITPLFGGIPVTGAIARTAVNVKSGGHTRLSSLYHAIFLLLIMMVFAPLVSFVPLATLGGILLVVSYRMAELPHVKRLIEHADRPDMAVLAITFLLTVFMDLTISIPVGISLAGLLFIKRMSELGMAPTVIDRTSGTEPKFIPSRGQLRCPHLSIYTLQGPLFFGAARRIISNLKNDNSAHSLILRLKHVSDIDITGMNALREILSRREGYREIYLTGLQSNVQQKLEKAGIVSLMGENHVFDRTKDAINQALLDQGLGHGCDDYHVL